LRDEWANQTVQRTGASRFAQGGITSALALFCGKHGLRALVLVDGLREQAVRGVLSHAGLAPFQDDLLQDNAPGLQFALASTSGIEHFVRELLIHGLGATQASPLEFTFHERNAA
jgi:hypothetical protein